ncbi:MAG: translation elongation factor Ts [Candidatus Peribacteraceae bacterium]|nr:translation elongation factor Ts [Candidatus Peribacteraceae bacterium]
MAEITAALVKELRDATGIAMLKCKKALEEATGDLEKARDILRKAGEADAAKRSERDAGEGVVAVKISKDGQKAAAVQLFCETDFVAKNEEFTKLADELAAETLAGADVASTSEPKIQEAIQKNGENIKLGEIQILEGEAVSAYIHSNNKIGVLVAGKGKTEVLNDVAMQIAAMSPTVVKPEEVSDEEVAKEAEIQKEILAKEGKPADMVDKIMEGKLRKFREEKSLLKQAFVKDASKTVEQFLAEKSAQVDKFIRLAI